MPIRRASRKYSPIKDRTFANGLTFASPLSSSSTALSYIRFAVVYVLCVCVCEYAFVAMVFGDGVYMSTY